MMKKMKINKLKVSVENSIFDVLNHEQELLVMNEWMNIFSRNYFMVSSEHSIHSVLF